MFVYCTIYHLRRLLCTFVSEEAHAHNILPTDQVLRKREKENPVEKKKQPVPTTADIKQHQQASEFCTSKNTFGGLATIRKEPSYPPHFPIPDSIEPSSRNARTESRNFLRGLEVFEKKTLISSARLPASEKEEKVEHLSACILSRMNKSIAMQQTKRHAMRTPFLCATEKNERKHGNRKTCENDP